MAGPVTRGATWFLWLGDRSGMIDRLRSGLVILLRSSFAFLPFAPPRSSVDIFLTSTITTQKMFRPLTFVHVPARLATSMSRRAARPLSTSAILRQTRDGGKPTFGFKDAPAPPRLPKEEQDIFEELQRRSTGAFSTPQVNQSPQSDSQPTINAKGNGEELHPDAPKGLKPEFEGEKNPKTGEIGGPKNEPLRWGSGGDWSYGGRVTDF
ncbi:Succinate dehydrogenase assembly factor 4 [Penicillium oxalicum]|nr:Succinate dehydrogenase assembly factor 4 [Penicillium oxalicum]KAI2789235.1 Succinate dehydrogenase assembly factor 4 [Penicillium oxalicum]